MSQETTLDEKIQRKPINDIPLKTTQKWANR